MTDVVEAFYSWLSEAREDGWPAGASDEPRDVQRYFHGIARARFVLRKVFRMVDEQARRAGLDPLEHQALIQIFGADDRLRINDVAERLDIAPALASRLVKSLEGKGLVTRTPSLTDRRTTLVTATTRGQQLLVDIDTQVQVRVGLLQDELTDLDRAAALGIFAFYVGSAPAREHFTRLATVFQPR